MCDGCSQRFCRKHLDEHHQNLEREFDQIETNHDELRQMINEHKQDPKKHPLIEQIDQWEVSSIKKITETANQCRDEFINYANSFFRDLEKQLDDLARRVKVMREENEFNDLDVKQLKERLNQLQKELLQPPNVFLNKESTSFINSIPIRIQTRKKNYVFTYCF